MTPQPDFLAPLTLESADLKAVQLARLRDSLAHAYAGNPAYRTKFDAAGIKPDALQSLDDLARFPFTTKADLRAAYPFGFFATPMAQIARIHASQARRGNPPSLAIRRRISAPGPALWRARFTQPVASPA